MSWHRILIAAVGVLIISLYVSAMWLLRVSKLKDATRRAECAEVCKPYAVVFCNDKRAACEGVDGGTIRAVKP